ncbi:MAG: phosphoribosylamine--glycine ligase [Acidobacteria bacterium]|nr:phosphoribosylamine--glycine ligase [Acidobacteriota bacterium]
MKALVIGSGGREHAIAWRLALEPGVEVFSTPGNPGIARVATCIPSDPTPAGYLAAARSVNADLTIVGPEAPLVAGVADAFLAADLKILGPSQAAAQLEASKVFSKKVMVEAGIPTAAYRIANTIEEARAAFHEFHFPVVLKADGLAAGKGVIIANNAAEAEDALAAIHSALGPRIVIEEFLTGEEASFIALCDGASAIPLDASQDHKTIYDDDRGPNTGGMGSYSDGRVLTPAQMQHAMVAVIQPTLDYMRAAGTPFVGFLYAGLMITPAAIKVLEFNVRLGDPETQTLLHRIQDGFADALLRAANHNVAGAELTWKSHPSVCVVMAAHGYPGKPRTGDAIHGLAQAEATGATVFQAGTRAAGHAIATSGGRVLGVTSSGDSLHSAIANTYRAVEQISFDGMQYRKDIGRKGLKRW